MRLFSNHSLLIVAFLLVAFSAARADVTIEEAAKALPDRIGSFHALGPADMPMKGVFEFVKPWEVGAVSHAARGYTNDRGFSFEIELFRTETDSGAFALLTRLAGEGEDIQTNIVGVVSFATPGRIVFCKGENLAQVWKGRSITVSDEQLLQFARAFAATLDSGEDDIPALVKHLPNWETMMDRVSYAVSLEGLKAVVHDQPIVDAISFEGGSEAVADNYGQSQLVIVEFGTPQLAGDNDRRIVAKLQELKGQGQPAPTAYRRVGNYLVFVFNAPDEQTANQLIDQVKYEQVVRWLGDNPRILERLQQWYAETSAGVFIAVLESSGLSLLLCLGIGGLVGALLFRHRRAQQRKAVVYSDAGGMVRLNLDEITETTDARARLRIQEAKQRKTPNAV